MSLQSSVPTSVEAAIVGPTAQNAAKLMVLSGAQFIRPKKTESFKMIGWERREKQKAMEKKRKDDKRPKQNGMKREKQRKLLSESRAKYKSYVRRRHSEVMESCRISSTFNLDQNQRTL